MSEGNVTDLSTEKDENFQNEKGIIEEDNNHKPAMFSDDSSASENLEITAEKVIAHENRQSPDSSQTEEQDSAVLGSLETNMGSVDLNPEQQQDMSDASSETKSSEDLDDSDESEVSSANSEIKPSEVPASDKGLEGVAENIQLIYEGLKDMKITTEEIPVPASGKKGRKPPTTPRAKSTPVKPLTSPPLTRSRSRDLRKFPSTPSSPRSSAYRKNSDSDPDDVKVVRGRQKVKRN